MITINIAVGVESNIRQRNQYTGMVSAVQAVNKHTIEHIKSGLLHNPDIAPGPQLDPGEKSNAKMSLLIQTEQSKNPILCLLEDGVIVPLDKGLFAIIDKEDEERICKYKWHAHLSHGRYYAMRTVHSKGSTYQVRMHRQIMHTPNGQINHHKNRYTMDNRRKNIPCMTDMEHKEIHNLSF